MKTLMFAASALFIGLTAASYADPVKDVRALEEAHHHLQDSIRELNAARSANHYDMAGHGEKELREGIEAARKAK